MTAAVARGRDFDFYRAVGAIAHVGPRIAKRWIHEAAGNTLLRNLFRDTWPPVDDVGDLTVAAAIQLELVDAVAIATSTSSKKAAAAMEGARGNTLVKNLFGSAWPTHPHHGEEAGDDDEEDEEDDDVVEEEGEEGEEEEVELDEDEIGRLTVAQARDDWAEAIADITGLPLSKVERVLAETNGRTLVCNAFADVWPEIADGIDSEPPSEPETEEDGEGWVKEVLAAIATRGRNHERSRPFAVLRDRFELLAKLGQGGFGTAYAARDRLVANGLIVVKTAPDHSQGYDALFREVIHNHDLQHRNICKLLQLDEDPTTGSLFLTMQYAGVSAEWILEKHGVFPTDFALKVVRGAAQGLHHAHENAIVHRDVSPGNILVDDRARVRVTDFGVSALGHMATVAASHRTVVVTDDFGYNPSYAAPEVRRGGLVRRAADQYSLARCLCAMLEGESLDEHYGLRRFERLSTGQNDAIKRALSKDAGDRFPTILDFAEAVAG